LAIGKQVEPNLKIFLLKQIRTLPVISISASSLSA
jgi:hypothetical protein